MDFDFFSTGMFPGDEVVDGVATLDPFTDLSASTEYKVVVKGTKNIVITSYSIHYTKLYEGVPSASRRRGISVSQLSP